MAHDIGKLIVFEGVDNAGKTTLSQALAKRLSALGHRCEWHAFPGRAPKTLGALVYGLHHDARTHNVANITPLGLQTLHVAAHLDAIESSFLPLLEEGGTVVLDKFWWSTWAYGITTGVPPSVLKHLIDAERALWGNVLPTLTFLVTRESQPQSEEMRPSGLACVYRNLANEESERYPVHEIKNIDTLGASIDKVLSALSEYWDYSVSRLD